jgi:hypothetical protein
MLRKLLLHNVGPKGEIGLDRVAPRLNLVTGDNGLGKSFLLEAAWWAMTRTWHEYPAVPLNPDARITHHYDKDSGGISTAGSKWIPEGQYWKRKPGRPPNPGLVMYARVDGSFSAWDPARNYRLYTRRAGGEAESPGSYQFTSHDVLDGLKRTVNYGGRDHEEVLCRGLIDEWREWQRADDPRFELLRRLLAVLGPDDEPLVPGELFQPSLDDDRLIPTVRMPYGEDVPITYAPAGVRRMCKLAYLLAWVLSAHEKECARIERTPSRQVIILVDEIETHLHPRWQRTVLPSLLKVLERWHDGSAPDVQFLVASHSPLVMASVEPFFDPKADALWKLDIVDGSVRIQKDVWRKRGDANRWLKSDVFDLREAVSKEAEQVIIEAGQMLASELDAEEVRALDTRILGLFSEQDPFFLRWRHYVGHVIEETPA